MKKYTFYLWMLALGTLALSPTLQAQCPVGQSAIEIEILPDNYPLETTWELHDQAGNLIADGGSNSDTACVSDSACLTFTIFDSYGDGICCGNGNGSWTLHQDTSLIATGGQFTTSESFTFGNCATGFRCEIADNIGLGTYTTGTADYWYSFAPDSTGTYRMHTCSLSTCDTRIWMYDRCQGLNFGPGYEGTISFNDNACGLQSEIIAHLQQGEQYYIRVGALSGQCTAINWELEYLGPVIDCMDSAACNYNPLATLPDTCYYPGDSLCPDGPDLELDQATLENSLFLGTLNNTDGCMIQEQCVADYGTRDILRFSTWIRNVGNQDYYIGSPSDNPGMFTYDNCHGHYHFEGYAEYLLYDANANLLPIGFKNGFCVLDVECSGGGIPKYGCSNMGITAGCGDIYSTSVECQWIDITDVPSGRYTLVVRTNWNQLPDALGRVETDYSNNWIQVCFELNRDPTNQTITGFQIDPDCPGFVDCAGNIAGNALYDCQGVCNGPALRGDIDQNQAQETADAAQYIQEILTGAGQVTTCLDLNSDSVLNVTDAAMINACAIRGSHYLNANGGTTDYCDLPYSITNIFDQVQLRIGNIDTLNSEMVIEIKNPDCRVTGYQIQMSGITLHSATNLIPAAEYPITPNVNSSGTVIGLSLTDSSIARSADWRPLVKLNYTPTEPAPPCIDQIVDIVNENYENTLHAIENSCNNPVGFERSPISAAISLVPNPTTDQALLKIELPNRQPFELRLLNIQGRVIRDYGRLDQDQVLIQREKLPPGTYFYRLKHERQVYQGRLIIQ